MILRLLLCGLLAVALSAQEFRLEALTGKTILLFTPHPDDDTFCCAGALALLQRGGNRIHIVIYTNDDKGSNDLEMTSERLARIRKAEEEEACRLLGIPKENIHWLQYHDGMLEYANTRDLVEQATAIIRRYRPDAVFSVDPGADTVRWHKTDHRMAAMNTIDAVRAAEWHLYFPNQRLHDGLEPWAVPLSVFYYVTPKDANHWVDIGSVAELKLDAAMAHVSQWEPAIRKYRPDWDAGTRAKTREKLRARLPRHDGKIVEAFRVAREFNQQ